jgi:hypothetical protein
MGTTVTIIDPSTPPPVSERSALRGDVVLLPSRLEGDHGVYPEALTGVVKALRADGVDAHWSHDADHRVWTGERSVVLDLVAIPFVVGIASSAGWAGLVRLLTRRKGIVKLKVGYRKHPSVGEERWIELEGEAKDVATTLEGMIPWPRDESIPGTGRKAIVDD